MNKIIFSFLVAQAIALPLAAQTQPSAPVDYTEKVVVEGAGRGFLYARALDWAQHKFNYAPTTALITDASAATVRVTGTSTLKPVDSRGEDQNLTVQFTFRFQATDNGYTYHVTNFEVVPDVRKPAQKVPLVQYRTELQDNRNNKKSHNDRRLAAQATSLASEAAMSFRSFMNSQPSEDHVGVPGQQQDGQ